MKARWINVATLLTAPATIGAVAPYCAHWHWSIDLLACFPVQCLGVLLLGATVFALARKWLLAGCFAAFAAVAGSAILPEWLPDNNSPEPVENAPQIKVLSLNLLHDNHKGQQRALEVVRNLAPDLIWCVEYTPAWQQFFANRLPDFPYRCQLPKEGSFGAALFSRHPLPLAEMIPLGHSWAPACRAVVQTAFGPIGFLGVHTPPPGLGSRRCEERDLGMRAIPRALQNLPERRIVCGDFNSTPWNSSFRQLRATTDLSAGTTTDWLPSWPAGLPAVLRVPIDHILVAGPLRIEQAQLGPDFGSDHLPLFAMVRVLD